HPVPLPLRGGEGARRAGEGVSALGLDASFFGQHPNGPAIDAASLGVHAPSLIEIPLPAELVAGCEFVTTGSLQRETGAEGSVQFQVFTNKPALAPGLVASATTL